MVRPTRASKSLYRRSTGFLLYRALTKFCLYGLNQILPIYAPNQIFTTAYCHAYDYTNHEQQPTDYSNRQQPNGQPATGHQHERPHHTNDTQQQYHEPASHGAYSRHHKCSKFSLSKPYASQPTRQHGADEPHTCYRHRSVRHSQGTVYGNDPSAFISRVKTRTLERHSNRTNDLTHRRFTLRALDLIRVRGMNRANLSHLVALLTQILVKRQGYLSNFSMNCLIATASRSAPN